MEQCGVILIKMSANDKKAILEAYRQNLAGRPLEELQLDNYQKGVLTELSKAVSSGKSCTQISLETGHVASFISDMKLLRYRYRRDLKASKLCYSKTGQAAIEKLQLVYGMKVITPKKRDIFEIWQMLCDGEKVSKVRGVPEAVLKKVRSLKKMLDGGATAGEISQALNMPEADVKKLTRMRKKKQSVKNL